MPKIPMNSTMCMNAAKNNKADVYLYGNRYIVILDILLTSLPTPYTK